jgi:hypothetical protein
MNSSLTRRELLMALAAAPLALPQAESELVVCGADEVFILTLGSGANPPHRKVWSWRVADSPEIPEAMRAAFRTTDDCKPVDEGRRILISSSGGAIALVDRQTKRASFHARVTNAHSVEMLPGGRIAAAASTSNAGTGNRVLLFDAATGRELASDELYSGHGVVWDAARGVLWALGGNVLRAYAIGAGVTDTKLERAFELALPDAGGHDLIAIPGSPRLFLSTLRHCWYFDRDTRRIEPHDTLADQADIKSYGVHPRSGRIVYTQAERPNWWMEHIRFQQPDGVIRLPGERLYKVRWSA